MNKPIMIIDRTVEFSLYGLILTLTFSISLMEIFFGSMLIFWFAKRAMLYKKSGGPLIMAFRPAATELNLQIMIFVFASILSVFFSHSIPLGLKGLFLKIFKGVAVYFITVETVNSRNRLNRILAVTFFSMTLMAANGIFQSVNGTDFIRHFTSGSRIQSSFGNANGFAGWLIVMIPLALSVACLKTETLIGFSAGYKRFRRVTRPFFWLLTVALSACLVMTSSRGALLAMGGGLVFFGIIKGKKSAIITIAVLLVLFFSFSDSIRRQALSVINIQAGSSLFRWNLWHEAFAIIEDFPFFGCGLNNYAVVGPYYKIPGGGGFYPHNSYLQMASELGLIGLGAFIWIIIRLFRVSFTNLAKIKNEVCKSMSIGLLAGLLAFLMHSFVDTDIYMLQLGNLMWFIAGLIIAVQDIGCGKIKGSSRSY